MDRPLTQQQRSDMMKCSRDYFLAIGMLIFSSAMIYVASTDPTFLTNRIYLYTALICIPLFAGSYFILPMFRRQFDAVGLMSLGLLILIIVIVVYFMMRTANTASVVWGTYFFIGVSIGAALVAAIAIYRISIKSLKNVRGWNGFVLNLIFYIPCLIIELCENALVELQNMPRIVAVSLSVVLGIVCLMYLPQIQNWVSGRIDDVRSIMNYPRVLGKNVLPTAVSLSKKTAIAGNDVFAVPTDTEFVQFVKVDALNSVESAAIQASDAVSDMEPFTLMSSYRKNYSISAWIYLNATQPTSSPVNILQYGEGASMVGKPSITYVNSKVVVALTDNPKPTTDMKFEIDAPFQKWFMVAVSYSNNKASVFLDGQLVYGTDMAGEMIPSYSMTDVLTVGDDNGLSGAICTVMYYETPITISQVVAQYNLLKKLSPPIIV